MFSLPMEMGLMLVIWEIHATILEAPRIFYASACEIAWRSAGSPCSMRGSDRSDAKLLNLNYGLR